MAVGKLPPQQPQQQVGGLSKNQQLGLFLSSLSDVFAGKDPTSGLLQRQQFLQQQQLQQQQQKINQDLNALIDQSDLPETQKGFLKAMNPKDKYTALFPSGTKDSAERFGIYDRDSKELIGTVLKSDQRSIQQYETDPSIIVSNLRAPIKDSKSSVSNPLRTVTKGGKVQYNIRDLDLTPEKIKEINESGLVIQPLGFTEKFESSKEINLDEVKSKYLATENIIIKTSELADQFIKEPSSSLAIGTAAQFIDGVIQNIDVGGDILSGAKNKKVYNFIQNTNESIEGKDFTDAIKKASVSSGVTESRIRDLAYLFAAARGQEGRGLSDKDYENALKIVAGGVGPEGRIAVLQDVANNLRGEFYRTINFDVATNENPNYVERLQNLPPLPYFKNPLQQPTATKTSNNDPLGIRQ